MKQKFFSNKILILIVFFIFPLSGWAEGEFKIATIDVQRVLANISGGKRIKQILEEEMKAKQKLIQSNQDNLKTKKEEFDKNSLVWSPTKKLEEQKKLEKEMFEFQKMIGQADGDMQRRQVELMQPILLDIKNVVTKLAQQKRFNLVLEKNSSGVLYTADAQDITDEVTLDYEKTFGGKGKSASKSSGIDKKNLN